MLYPLSFTTVTSELQRHDKSIRDFTSIADVKSNARHVNSIELFIKGRENLPNIW